MPVFICLEKNTLSSQLATAQKQILHRNQVSS